MYYETKNAIPFFYVCLLESQEFSINSLDSADL